jgi:hypothetical protein
MVMGEHKTNKVVMMPRMPRDPNDLPSYHCPVCGSDCFLEVFGFRQIHGMMSQTGRTEAIRLGPLLKCANTDCGKIVPIDELVVKKPGERIAVVDGKPTEDAI